MVLLFLDAVEIYLLDGEAQNLSPKTTDTRQSRLSAFVAEVGNLPLADVTPSHIRIYLANQRKQGKSDYTVLGAYRDLRAFFNFSVREGWLDASPLANVKSPKIPQPQPKVFTPDQVKRILRAATNKRNRAMTLMLLDTGMRAAELLALDVPDLDMKTGTVQVMGKGRKVRTVYAGAMVRRAIATYLLDVGKPDDGPLWLSKDGDRLSYRALAKYYRVLSQRLGFQIQCHTFRRTYATEQLRAGVNVYALRDAMGHADIATLRHYVRIAQADLRKAQLKSVVETMLKK